MVKSKRALAVLVLVAVLALGGVAGTAVEVAAAGTRNANLAGPWVPASVSAGKLFGITGTIDKAAASGPIRILFYQKIRGTWVLQKTESARWSGYNATTTKYVLDTTVPYAGEWRIGASYGGNSTYAPDYRYQDFMVAPGTSSLDKAPYQFTPANSVFDGEAWVTPKFYLNKGTVQIGVNNPSALYSEGFFGYIIEDSKGNLVTADFTFDSLDFWRWDVSAGDYYRMYVFAEGDWKVRIERIGG